MIKADHVVINLSAVDRQQYHDLHGKDLFDRVVNNIKRLVSLRDAGKPGFRSRLFILSMPLISIKNKRCGIWHPNLVLMGFILKK